MSATRNRFLPTLGVARRFVAAVDVDHVHVAGMAVRRTCSPAYRWNAACWRLLDHNVRMTHSVTQPWIRTKDECQEMMALWPDVAHDLMEGAIEIRPEVHKWMAEVLQYNVPGGKKTRGLTVTYAYKLLASNNQLTENNIRLTRILGLCIGMLQAYSLLLDEVPDRLLLRKYLPEWWNSDGFGAQAYDCGMLRLSFNHVIIEHFKENECFYDLIELFEEMLWETIRYQWSESKFINFDKKLNLNLFTMQEYDSIVQYKTSNFSFLLPVITAMHFAGVNNVDKLRQAEGILLDMGHLFQVQDDYLAIFGNIDKDSSDIEEGKCTWLVVEALQQATPEQRKILKECYNSSDPEKVRRVKQLFIDLGLPNTYSIYEEERYNLLNKEIQKISRGPLHSFFLDLLGKLYRRVV